MKTVPIRVYESTHKKIRAIVNKRGSTSAHIVKEIIDRQEFEERTARQEIKER